MESLISLLGAERFKTVALVGSGGKTTLLWRMAGHFRGRQTERVLVSATTKIAPPAPLAFDRFYSPAALQAGPALPGVTLAGEVFPQRDITKLGLDDAALLGRAAAGYSRVLLEADGSKQLPLKGWAGHEPVVPSFADATVGLLPLWPLGLPADEKLIHRPERFCPLAGLRPGEVIGPQHLARVITAREGLFGGARGARILLLTQVENRETQVQAEQLVSLLDKDFLAGLSAVVAGSARQNEGVLLWSR